MSFRYVDHHPFVVSIKLASKEFLLDFVKSCLGVVIVDRERKYREAYSMETVGSSGWGRTMIEIPSLTLKPPLQIS